MTIRSYNLSVLVFCSMMGSFVHGMTPMQKMAKYAALYNKGSQIGHLYFARKYAGMSQADIGGDTTSTTASLNTDGSLQLRVEPTATVTDIIKSAVSYALAYPDKPIIIDFSPTVVNHTLDSFNNPKATVILNASSSIVSNTTLGTVNASNGGTVTLSGNSISNLNIGASSVVTVENGSAKIVNVKNAYFVVNGSPGGKIEIDEYYQDPAVKWLQKPVVGASVPYLKTMVFGTSTDTYNALIMDPNAQLKTSSLTLMNENILLIAYDMDDPTDLTVGSNILINGPVSKPFDYVWKVAIKNNQAQLDSLTDISNGTAGTTNYLLSVDQKDLSNITLNVADVGGQQYSTSLVDMELVKQIFAINTEFEKFFFTNLKTGDVDTAALSVGIKVNSIIAAFQSAKGSLAPSVDNANSNFRQGVFKALCPKNIGTDEKIEKLLHALAENGPLQVDNEQYRLWLAPYMTVTNNSADSTKADGFGALVGAEFRQLKYRLTFGAMAGYTQDKLKSTTQSLNTTKSKGFVLGAYGFYNPWYDGRLDMLYLYTGDINNKNSFDPNANVVNQQKYKSNSNTLDIMVSQVFRALDKAWSFRLNAGNTIIWSHTDEFTIGNNNNQESKGRSQEVYGGVGVRWNNKSENLRTRITFVYEYGKEYVQTGNKPRVKLLGTVPLLATAQPLEKSETSYFSGNISFLTQNTWKFILTYNGAYTKDSKNHTVMAKVEYRF